MYVTTFLNSSLTSLLTLSSHFVVSLAVCCRKCRALEPLGDCDPDKQKEWDDELERKRIAFEKRKVRATDKKNALEKIWLDRDTRNATRKKIASEMKKEYLSKIASIDGDNATDEGGKKTLRKRSKKEYRATRKEKRVRQKAEDEDDEEMIEWKKFYSKKKKKKQWRIL